MALFSYFHILINYNSTIKINIEQSIKNAEHNLYFDLNLILNLSRYMDKKSTQKLLLQYIYGEMSASQNLFIEELLQADANLKAQHDALAIGQVLPKFTLYPRKKTLQNILSYSRSEVCV